MPKSEVTAIYGCLECIPVNVRVDDDLMREIPPFLHEGDFHCVGNIWINFNRTVGLPQHT